MVRKTKKNTQTVCFDCGETFIADSPDNSLCPKCICQRIDEIEENKHAEKPKEESNNRFNGIFNGIVLFFSLLGM